MKDLNRMSIEELKQLMVDRYDGNAGEIIFAFEHELKLKGKKLKDTLIRYIERVPATVIKFNR